MSRTALRLEIAFLTNDCFIKIAVLSFGRGEIVALVEVLYPRACFDNVEMRGRQDSRTLFIAVVTAFADWEVCAVVSDLFYELAW